MDQKKKILLIEDDVNTRTLYVEVLEEAGFAVTPAVDGQEGLDHYKQGGFDLVLLDIIMPKIDGLTFLKQLKETKANNGPIIVSSNLSPDPYVKQALDLGASAFFVKSDLNPDELIEKVKGYLGQTQSSKFKAQNEN